jgi:hypothetical protein
MEQIPESRSEKLGRISTRLQKTAFFAMAFMVVLSFMLTNLQALLWQTSDWLVGAVLPGVVATLTNAERERYAVAPLSRSAILDEAARMKAEHMAAESYFSHDSPGGITPWYWFTRVGYVYAHAGENLAVHFQDSDEVVRAWMNSPTHKANVVGPQYTEIGIGTAKGRYQGYDTVFVVQLFGTPALRPTVVPVAALPADTSALPVVEVSSDVSINEIVTTNNTEQATLPSVLPARDDETTGFSLLPELQENYAVHEKAGATEVYADYSSTPIYLEHDYLASSFTATSSGLLPYLEGREFVAGTTVSTISTLATKPRTVLQGIYMAIGTIVVLMLTISVIIGYRTHHIRTVLIGVALLLIMSLLFIWHIAITGGAVVA